MALPFTDLNSITRAYIEPRVTDNAFSNNPALWDLVNGHYKEAGGTTIGEPILYATKSIGGRYTAFDQLDLTPEETKTRAEVNWSQFYFPASISGLDLIQNQSAEGVVDLLMTRAEEASLNLGDALGTGIFSDGTGSPQQIDGFRAITGSGTYAGISPSDASNWAANRDTSTSTLTIRTATDIISTQRTRGARPNVIYTNDSTWSKGHDLVQTNERFPHPGSDRFASAGHEAIAFLGIPLVSDSHSPGSGRGTADNQMFYLAMEYISLRYSKLRNFTMTDWRQPSQQDAIFSLIFWSGNMICRNRRGQAVMTVINPTN